MKIREKNEENRPSLALRKKNFRKSVKFFPFLIN
jgi:hypothetical protein